MQVRGTPISKYMPVADIRTGSPLHNTCAHPVSDLTISTNDYLRLLQVRRPLASLFPSYSSDSPCNSPKWPPKIQTKFTKNQIQSVLTPFQSLHLTAVVQRPYLQIHRARAQSCPPRCLARVARREFQFHRLAAHPSCLTSSLNLLLLRALA